MITTRDWLEGLGLQRYAAAFEENDLDIDTLTELTADDLREIGVESLGHRKKLLKAVVALQSGDGTASEQAGVTVDGTAQSNEGERRQITVMFCDLVGSTELSTRFDAEDMDAVIRSYQERVSPTIREFGGHVARFAGDGILSYFGYPSALEHEAERAIHAALKIVHDIDGAELHPGEKSQVRIGIATGDVVIGGLYDSGKLFEAMATGETPNLAARLQSFVGPGGIAVCDTTRRLAATAFEFRDEGRERLRGFRDEVPIFSVTRSDHQEHAADGLRASRQRSLKGRERELAALAGAWRQARIGKGVTVLVRGEAGVGKTHILNAFRDGIPTAQARTVRLYCQPYFQSSPFHSIIEWLNREMLVNADEPAAERRQRLDEFASRELLEPARGAALLACLLNIANDADWAAVGGLSPQRLRDETIDLLARYLAGGAVKRRLVIQVEDVHWADASTLQFLEVLASRIASLPVLLLLSARPDFELDWQDDDGLLQVALQGLSDEVVQSMIDDIVGSTPLPEGIRRQIIEKADGIPLYVEELTRSMVEEIRHSGAGAVTEVLFDHASVPDALQSTLMARLDRLGKVKDLALHCAVLGREFEREMLTLVVDEKPADISRALKVLVEAELIEPVSGSTTVGFTFRHALLRDAAYNNLLKGRRREIHQRVARVLEDHYPQRVAAHPEQIARHWTDGGDVARAVPAWLAAGARAMRASANFEAVKHLRKGLSLVAELSEPAERLPHELKLQMTLGPALIPIHGFAAPEVKEAFDRARDICEQLGNAEQLFPVLRGLMAFYTVSADYGLALSIGEELEKAVRANPSPGREIEWRWNVASALMFYGNIAEAVAHLEQCEGLYDAEEHAAHRHTYGQDPEMAVLAHLAVALNMQGAYGRAREVEERVRTFAEELEHPFSRAQGLAFVDSCMGTRGEREAVLASTQDNFEFARSQGFSEWQGMALLEQGLMMARGGDPEGVEFAERGYVLYRGCGAQCAKVRYLSMVAEAHLHCGSLDQGLALTGEAFEHAEACGERAYVAELNAVHARLLLAKSPDNADEALRLFRDGVASAESIGARHPALVVATAWARHEQASGSPGAGTRALSDAIAKLAGEGNVPVLDEARALLDATA